MVVDRDPNVIFPHELFNVRKDLGRRVARNDYRNARLLAVFKLASNISIVVLWKIDSSGSVEFDPCRGIVFAALPLLPADQQEDDPWRLLRSTR